ncbi:hypothetical protein [Staphylococcus kloosii]|uniref:hypothetical protein n=1 Tax=Staphylococcus kloosii TaxID=29384 RepID=UPI0028A34F5B|nr:hypothetical protein [Staphylococcus kloosii]MDT3959806.1 hypothetical protein [Staphylococcus kloosii]
MENKSNGLGGYTIAIFCIIFGFFWFMFSSGGLIWVGFPFLIFGFLGLLVELNEEGYKKYCYFIGGVGMAFLSLYFGDYEFFILKFIFAVLICGAMTCFVVGAIYAFKISDDNGSFADILFKIFDIAGAVYSAYSFLKNIIDFF